MFGVDMKKIPDLKCSDYTIEILKSKPYFTELVEKIESGFKIINKIKKPLPKITTIQSCSECRIMVYVGMKKYDDIILCEKCNEPMYPELTM